MDAIPAFRGQLCTLPVSAAAVHGNGARVSSRRSEEFERDVVRVTEGQARAVGRINDAAIGYAELVQAAFPILELGPARTGEGEMIQAWPTLVERFGALQIGELVKPDKRPFQEPDDMVEGTGIFIDQWVRAEQLLIPGAAASEVGHCESHVGDRRKRGHRSAPCCEMCSEVSRMVLRNTTNAHLIQLLKRVLSHVSAHACRAYYPEGREEQRPRTLLPLPEESPRDVVELLARLSEQLNQEWLALDPVVWGVEIVEPQDNPDLGPIPLGRLPLLRLTEVEVHGTDLGLDLVDWSDAFITTVLPMRLEWLNARRANHRVFDAELRGAWLLVATDGPTYKVSVEGRRVESGPASPDTPARAVIETTSRDLLALLLGRVLLTPPTITGDIEFGQSFSGAFPGP
jgi:hypothetical protein